MRNINRGGATDTRQTKNEGKHYILWYKVILSLSYTLYDNKEDRVKSDKSKSRQINEYDKPEEEKKRRRKQDKCKCMTRQRILKRKRKLRTENCSGCLCHRLFKSLK